MAGCACSAAPTLIFPCSGGSDCGAVADLAARTLTRDGVGKMCGLAVTAQVRMSDLGMEKGSTPANAANIAAVAAQGQAALAKAG